MNYSDKAVSKWERGESIPDVSVLKNIADLFGVTVDYLLQETHAESKKKKVKAVLSPHNLRNRKVTTSLSILLVWLVATVVYVILDMIQPDMPLSWLTFVYAVPVCVLVWLVLNSTLLTNRKNYFIVSLLMWTLLPTIWLTLWIFWRASWKLLLLGIPGQIIILAWSRFQHKTDKE